MLPGHTVAYKSYTLLSGPPDIFLETVIYKIFNDRPNELDDQPC